jgi:hypothetical protein
VSTGDSSNSGDQSNNNDNSGSTNSSSNSASNNGGSSNSGISPTDSLTNNLNELKDHGSADVKLSPATRDKYLKIISGFRTGLATQRTQMDRLTHYGNVGTLVSALQTKDNLLLDVTNAQIAMDKYLKYLDVFEDTVKKAADRLMHSG